MFLLSKANIYYIVIYVYTILRFTCSKDEPYFFVCDTTWKTVCTYDFPLSLCLRNGVIKSDHLLIVDFFFIRVLSWELAPPESSKPAPSSAGPVCWGVTRVHCRVYGNLVGCILWAPYHQTRAVGRTSAWQDGKKAASKRSRLMSKCEFGWGEQHAILWCKL